MSEITDHLQLIHVTISRMADHTFVIKGWSITVASALVALGVQQDDSGLIILGVLPTLAFWGLDAFYLWQERLYRRLWNSAVRPAHSGETTFSMDAAVYRSEEHYRHALFSPVVWAIHGTAIVAVIVIALFLRA